jgi:hypothetical protein
MDDFTRDLIALGGILADKAGLENQAKQTKLLKDIAGQLSEQGKPQSPASAAVRPKYRCPYSCGFSEVWVKEGNYKQYGWDVCRNEIPCAKCGQLIGTVTITSPPYDDNLGPGYRGPLVYVGTPHDAKAKENEWREELKGIVLRKSRISEDNERRKRTQNLLGVLLLPVIAWFMWQMLKG